MRPYIQALMEEQNELEYRISRTKKTTNKFSLDRQERAMLMDQLHTMRRYDKILSQRILYALQDALANLNESIDNGKRFKLNDSEKIFGFNDAACANICRVSEVTFQQWKYGQMSFPAWAAAKLGRELNFDVSRVDWPRKRSANAGGQS